MINNIIAALIALGFIKNNMESEDKKVLSSSWLKVLTYFVLSAITVIVFYKTYQVANIKTQVYVYGMRGSIHHNEETNTDEIGDTVSIDIYNKFSSTFQGIDNISSYQEMVDFLTDNLGGVVIYQTLKNDRNYPIINYPGLSLEAMQNEDIIDINGTGHLYYSRVINTEIPKLIPFLKIKGWEDEGIKEFKYEDGTVLKSRIRSMPIEGYLPEEGLDYLGRHGIMGLIERWSEISKNNSKRKDYPGKCVFLGKNLNTLDFFTAADLSQCTYDVNIYSACPIKSLSVRFDIPTEFSPIYHRVDTMDAYGFMVSDSLTLSKFCRINNGDYGQLIRYHVKFPTLANMQLIRSLIVTTLLTSFITLFLTSLYFRLKKMAYYLYKTNSTEILSIIEKRRKRKKLFKGLFICLILFLVYFIMKLWIFVLNDNPIKIEVSTWNNLKTALLVVFYIILIICLYKGIKSLTSYIRSKK